MPMNITCKECGELLYSGDLIFSPSQILRKFRDSLNDKSYCPKCNRELGKFYSKIDIIGKKP